MTDHRIQRAAIHTLGIHVGATRNQELGQFEIASDTCLMQRGAAVHVHRIHTCAVLHQQTRDLRTAVTRRNVQRSVRRWVRRPRLLHLFRNRIHKQDEALSALS